MTPGGVQSQRAAGTRGRNPRLQRASWRAAIEWIACNDNNADMQMDPGAISVLLVADLFGATPDRVATAVTRYRERYAAGT